MSVIHGKDIQIYGSSGVLIAAAQSCTIQRSVDIIETASTSPGDKTYIAGRKGWSIDLSYFISSGLSGMPMVGATYTINVKVGGTQKASGSAICTECDIQASMGNLAKGSLKLQGTGALSIT